jgi:hypothetical protein
MDAIVASFGGGLPTRSPFYDSRLRDSALYTGRIRNLLPVVLGLIVALDAAILVLGIFISAALPANSKHDAQVGGGDLSTVSRVLVLISVLLDPETDIPQQIDLLLVYYPSHCDSSGSRGSPQN